MNATIITKYFYADGLQVAKMVGTGVYYMHEDALGSTRLVTTSTVTVRFSSNYVPYGSSYGTIGNEVIMYAGEPYDRVTGLYLMGARFYDPSVGRFVTEDSYIGSNEDPKSRDRYVYAEDDPEKNRDPSGHRITQCGGDCGGTSSDATIIISASTTTTIIASLTAEGLTTITVTLTGTNSFSATVTSVTASGGTTNTVTGTASSATTITTTTTTTTSTTTVTTSICSRIQCNSMNNVVGPLEILSGLGEISEGAGIMALGTVTFNPLLFLSGWSLFGHGVSEVITGLVDCETSGCPPIIIMEPMSQS